MVCIRTVGLCLVALFAVAALAGCSSKTANPDTSAAAAPAPAQTTQSAPAATAGRDSTSSSSLEAMQRGESTATPAASPLKEIYFDFDSANLRADARDTLKANADWLKKNASSNVQIEGHCDERGTTEYNIALGAKRAQTAKDYLVTLGVDASHISTISYGKEVPVCTEHNEDCWARNRRDRFVVQATKPTA